MSKRTLRLASSDNGQSRSMTRGKKTSATHPTPQKTGVTILGKHLPDWNWGQVLLLVVSLCVILCIFVYNRLTLKAFLYSLGVLLAIKTRI